MFRFRRAWLLFPLLGLTLFFAACGWRNGNLEGDEEGVRLQSALYTALDATSQDSAPTVLWVLGVSPQSAAIIQKTLKEEHPNLNLRVISTSGEDESTFPERYKKFYVEVEPPELQNLFHATTHVSFNVPVSKTFSGNDRTDKVTLTRSPLMFWSNTWRVTSIEENQDQVGICANAAH